MQQAVRGGEMNNFLDSRVENVLGMVSALSVAHRNVTKTLRVGNGEANGDIRGIDATSESFMGSRSECN
jgi:hypothetical protein